MDIQEVLGLAYGGPAGPLCTAIHPNDEVFAFLHDRAGEDRSTAISEYFTTGNSAFTAIDQILRWLGRPWHDIQAMLDFASGYGRVTRFLCQAVPPQKVWVAEILPPAVPFQQQTFGVHGIRSEADAAKLRFPHGFDVITVISLFTHLPRATFEPWLAKLAGALNPGGVLVITTHGPELYQKSFQRPLAAPFLFEPLSEIPSLDPQAYGRTFCQPAFVFDIVRRIPGLEVLAHVVQGLNAHQDIFVLGRGCRRPAGSLSIRRTPMGAVDGAEERTEGGKPIAVLSGWALDGNDFGPVARVTVGLDGQEFGVVATLHPRADVRQMYGNPESARSGWRASGPKPAVMPEWVTLRIEDRQGARYVLARRAADVIRQASRR